MIHARLRQPTSWLLALTLVAGGYHLAVSAQAPRAGDGVPPLRLAPTNHPSVPGDPSAYLYVPTSAVASVGTATLETPGERLARAVRLIGDKNYTAALPVLNDRVFTTSPLFAYSRYYTAIALKNLNRYEEADAALIAATASPAVGYLNAAIPRLRADIALARQDPQTALAVLETITPSRAADPQAILLKLGMAAEQTGDPDKAIRAYRRVYFEYPLSAESDAARSALIRLFAGKPTPADMLPLELTRAEALFAARRWSDARDAFEAIGRIVPGADDRELATLRVAECDYYLNRHRQAREALRPFAEAGTRMAEARFFTLSITRALGDSAAYVLQARRFVQDFPASAWTEEVLDALATYYIVNDDNPAADAVFRDLLTRFPKSRFAERAGWKVGWAAYRAGRFAEAAQIFDTAAANAPRADFRPAWLYWSARAYDQLPDTATANIRYRLTATDYLNTYYGRLASRRLADRNEPPVAQSVTIDSAAMPSSLIPTSVLVRDLVGLGLYDDALHELEYAERAWGNSPAVQATTAWIRNQRAAQTSAMERFQNLRGAINIMKRAYPQYMAAGGETLPVDVLRIIFPLDYWPLIKAQAEERGLDPYLMAALVAQESTFTADVRSSANAYGLMQLIPATGRRYASKIGVRFTAGILTNPDLNVRMGMTYFRELMDRFGGAHFALASYNAGESRVARWLADRPGVPQDEFIDDIPFPETQNYVKRILGTAEDYRRLYGGGVLTPGLQPPPRSAAVATPATPASAAAAKPAPKAAARPTTVKKKPTTTRRPAARASKPRTTSTRRPR